MMARLHGLICMLQQLGSVFGALASLFCKWPWNLLGIAFNASMFFFGIGINEALLRMKHALCRGRVQTKAFVAGKNLQACLPIVYSTTYNITACGMEKPS